MKRSAPAAGYDFGNKRQYRRSVWRLFRDHCVGRLHESHALLMPSAEGDEIEVALSAGFREHNLHVVDRNPAIVAHLKRRYPKINTYGVSVSSAAKRIVESGTLLSVANLDLCSPLSDSIVAEVGQFMLAEPMSESALMAVTMLRGREQGSANKTLCDARNAPDVFKCTDAMRLFIVKMQCLTVFAGDGDRTGRGWSSGLVRHQVYRSSAGHQTMLWGVFRVRTVGEHRDDRRYYEEFRSSVDEHVEQFGASARYLADPRYLRVLDKEYGLADPSAKYSSLVPRGVEWTGEQVLGFARKEYRSPVTSPLALAARTRISGDNSHL